MKRISSLLVLAGLVLVCGLFSPAEAAKLQYLKGSTSVFVDVFIQDSSSTTGAGLTGLTSGSAGLVCYYARSDQGNAGGTQISLTSATRGTYTSSGFIEKDSANLPGVYELGLPTGVLATGSNYAIVMCKGGTNMAPMVLEIQLAGLDIQDAVRAGLTALPNAAAEAAGGLYTRGTGAGQITQSANGQIDTNLARILNTAVSTPATAGILDVNLKNINNTVVATPATAGVLDVNVKNINNVAAATPGASGGVLISGSNSGTTTLAALTVTGVTTLTGNVALADGLTIAQPSTANRAGLSITGNGTGAGLAVAAGATGKGVAITTTSGDGLSILPTAGHAIVATGNGTSKHGAFITGGTAGTSDGIKAAAGVGGVDIRGNITGSLSGSVGSVASTSGGVTLMAVDALLKNATSIVYTITIRDATTGAGLTGLTNASSGLTISYTRVDQGNAAATTCSPAAATRGSYTSCGFVQVDAPNQPGVYQFGIPNAAIASGSDLVTFYFTGVSGMIPTVLPIALVDTSVTSVYTRLGAPAGANISADIAAVQTSANTISSKTSSLSFTGQDLGVIVNNYASGKTPLQPTVAGRTLNLSTTGQAGLNFDDIKDATGAHPLTNITVPTVTTTTNLTNAPTVGDLTSTMKTSVTTAATAATPTAAAVTGAVGSVTGNVGGNLGGNVNGSVGSVVGAVGGNLGGNVNGTVVGSIGTYQKNVAGQRKFPIYMRDSTATLSGKAGLTLTVTVSKDGGAFVAGTGTVAEIGSGHYTYAPSQADTNCDLCDFKITGGGAGVDTSYAIHTH